MTAANFNYTNKKIIKRNDFSVTISPSQDDYSSGLSLDVVFPVSKFPENVIFILDAYSRAELERIQLLRKENQNIFIQKFSIENLPTFRLIVVSEDESKKGKILSSTKEFQLQSPEKKSATKISIKNEGFFEPKWKDLGECIWEVEWTSGNPEFILNKRLQKIYPDIKDPKLQAFVLPLVLKEILMGGLARNENYDSIESTELEKWFDFCSKRLDVPIPDNTDFYEGKSISDEWLSFVDDAMKAFSEKKWRNNKTMLELLEG